VTLVALIDHRHQGERRFQASLHGMQLEGDEIKTASGAAVHNASHAHLLRMKARRARGHG
jgi:hypothetical protein